MPFLLHEVRDSNAGGGVYHIKGLAVVYDQWSLDLGFREKIAPGALDNVLGREPHVVHTWDHDTSRALSSTRSKQYPLELRSVRDGMDMFSKVAPTSYSADLRTLIEGGIVSESSFAFTVAEDEWVYNADEARAERTVLEVGELFDVTTCAMGAYSQTSSALAVRSRVAALEEGRAATPVFFQSSGTSSSGYIELPSRQLEAEAQTDPDRDPGQAQDAPEEVVAPAEPAAPQEDGPAESPPAKPEEEEARQREFELWQAKRTAEHRRTREFAFGVTHQHEEE